MRTLIIADGGREQLAEWAGGYRHLIELDGEPLLERTVRQYAAHGDVFLLGGYDIPPAVPFQPIGAGLEGVDMLAKMAPYLNPRGRTNLIFGDVWFSDEAIETITAHDGDWQVFGRPGPSETTGTPWGEWFCMTLYPEHHELYKNGIRGAWEAWKAKRHNRASPWEVYFTMDKMPLVRPQEGAVPTGEHWTTIDDWTDDFDFIEDVVRWQERRNAWR